MPLILSGKILEHSFFALKLIDSFLMKLTPKVDKLIKYIFISLILFLSSYQHAFTQKSTFAVSILSDLCSENFHGRGYEYGSDKKVSEFIIDKLRINRLKAFNKSFLQPFNIKVNTFPSQNSITISSHQLKPGVDYIILSTSKSLQGTYTVTKLTPEIINDSIQLRSFIKKDFSNSALLIDTLGLGSNRFDEAYHLITEENILKAKLIIKVEDKNFIYVPSQIQKEFTCVSIKRNSIPSEIKTITIDIHAEWLTNYQTNNIIAYHKGKVDSSIVLTAHYDHIGMMGHSTFFPGANDNGSGVAMLLNLAQYFSDDKKLKYNIVFIFFSGEELGLLGSQYYSNHPFFPLSKIKFLINLDMVGTGSKGIKVVNGTVFKNEFNQLLKINDEKKLLCEITPRTPAANSDHYFFYEKGVKSFFIYTLGEYAEYHNIFDKPENLPLTEFDDLSELIIEFIKSF